MVVHYFIAKLNKDKPQTAHRSIKNFHANQSIARGPNWLLYQSINMEDMSKLIADSRDIADFGARICPARTPALKKLTRPRQKRLTG